MHIIVALSFFSGHSAHCAEYISMYNHHHSIHKYGTFSVDEGDSISIGDLSYEAVFCKPETGMACFEFKDKDFKDFKFAVPLDAGKRDAWEHGGVKYTSRKVRSSISFFGREGTFWFIFQEGPLEITFVYSDEFGLVAVTAKNSPTFLLIGHCGFAAAEGCPFFEQANTRKDDTEEFIYFNSTTQPPAPVEERTLP